MKTIFDNNIPSTPYKGAGRSRLGAAESLLDGLPSTPVRRSANVLLSVPGIKDGSSLKKNPKEPSAA